MIKKILVTGAGGQLGRSLRQQLEENELADYQFLFFDRQHFDITDKKVIEDFFFSNRIDICINCAAYTNVDKAESEVEKAFKVNADGVGFLAGECAEQNALLIHISTDYVFDGEAQQPYLPNDKPNPINVYGKSKLEGEKLAMELNPKTIIIRTSWLYSDFGKNFYTTIKRLIKEKDKISVVNDQIGKPTHAGDLANYILKLIQTEDSNYGIRHFTGKEQMSWFEFAQKIAKENNSKTEIIPILTSEYPTAAKRPKWSVLEN